MLRYRRGEGVPLKHVFLGYYLILIVFLVGLKAYAYATELIVLLGVSCFVSGIVIYLLIKILFYLYELSPERGRYIWLFTGYCSVFLILGALIYIWVYRGYTFSPYQNINKTVGN